MVTNYQQGHVGIGLRHALASCSLDVARVLPNLATWQCWQIFRAEKNKGETLVTSSVDRKMRKNYKHNPQIFSKLHSKV